MAIQEVTNFADIETEFITRVHRMVWCNLATVDSHSRPRSRIVHPIWEGSTGWLGTRPDSYKAKNLAGNAYVSLAYIAEMATPVYIEAKAEWVTDGALLRHVWDLYSNAAPPLGYNPEPIFGKFEAGRFGLLKFTPWRLELSNFPAGPQLVWRNQ